MINFPTCASGTRVYRVTINETADKTGGIKNGFLSCVSRVRNSFVCLKNMVVRGCVSIANMLHLSSASTPEKDVPVKTSLDPISVADTRVFSQLLRQKMAADPGYLDQMFRAGTTMTNCQFNEQLKDKDAFLSAINAEAIDNVAASTLVKRLVAEIIQENKFTVQERKMLLDNKDNRSEVNKIFEGKFDRSDADAMQNRDKLISLLSVMRDYKALSDVNRDMEGRQHDRSVVDILGANLLFDFDEVRLLDKTLSSQEQEEVKAAFAIFLSYCPPCALPRLAKMQS